jgi:hypothetical protein
MYFGRLVHILFSEYCRRRRPNPIGHGDILRYKICRRDKEDWLVRSGKLLAPIEWRLQRNRPKRTSTIEGGSSSGKLSAAAHSVAKLLGVTRAATL